MNRPYFVALQIPKQFFLNIFYNNIMMMSDIVSQLNKIKKKRSSLLTIWLRWDFHLFFIFSFQVFHRHFRRFSLYINKHKNYKNLYYYCLIFNHKMKIPSVRSEPNETRTGINQQYIQSENYKKKNKY